MLNSALSTPQTIAIDFTSVPDCIEQINQECKDIPLSNVILTIPEGTQPDDVSEIVAQIVETPITNLTVLVGPKLITKDKIDDISSLDFSALPTVQDFFQTIVDSNPEMVIPIITEDNVADSITMEELKLPINPIFLGKAEIRIVLNSLRPNIYFIIMY